MEIIINFFNLLADDKQLKSIMISTLLKSFTLLVLFSFFFLFFLMRK